MMRLSTGRIFLLLLFVILANSVSVGQIVKNPFLNEVKVKNYLPHMSWEEVQALLQVTDMAIIPVGAIEQHGKHLPMCTDIYTVIEKSKLIAQETDVLVAPSVFIGLSEHHMGFPGTLTLSPETFEAVIYETAQSLIQHGFSKIMIYNGHGGNNVSVANVIEKINQNTMATAVNLNEIEAPPSDEPEEVIPFDWHAGEEETSYMLYLVPSLVKMSAAEKPILTFPSIAQKAHNNMEDEPALELVAESILFRPKSSGKGASTKEMSNNGVITSGDPNNGTAERGQKLVQGDIKAIVKFIEAWKKLAD